MTTAAVLASKWRADAQVLRQYQLKSEAARLEDRAAELEAAFAAEQDVVLALPQAARESGYSPDHLARLIRQGRLPNAGRKHAPRVRRRDLPQRPVSTPHATVAVGSRAPYDPIADARSLLSRQGERDDDA